MKFQIYGGHFEGDNKKNEIRKLEEESNKPDFWNNRDNANEVINKINNLKHTPIFLFYTKLRNV